MAVRQRQRASLGIKSNLGKVTTCAPEDSVIKILDTLYHDRDYPRFFVLETIARVPYFEVMEALSSPSCRGRGLQELGGNAWWIDRFLAQHIAVAYYFMTALMYVISPRMAYHFSECVEGHAFETYDKFIKAQGEELKKLPAPEVAVKYYTGGDLYLFDEFQTARTPNSRRPKIENLYDVFLNIRDDEAEHCKTMKACQTRGTFGLLIRIQRMPLKMALKMSFMKQIVKVL
ncbi:ubiquinol oxidase 4 [Quercus suber]|uniref:Ubiquinol oxidase n=1 Tax=Quercus suber TaxID=58331 RepID=A0AAW0LUG0_QUESU